MEGDRGERKGVGFLVNGGVCRDSKGKREVGCKLRCNKECGAEKMVDVHMEGNRKRDKERSELVKYQ